MATQGPNSPGTFTNESNGSGNAWSNPSNAGASDDSYASIIMPGSFYGDNLYATNFGFSIPSGTINGITVEVEGKGSASGFVYIYRAQLTKLGAGTLVGTALGPSSNFTATDAYYTFGSASTLWGATWTTSEINDSRFGVRIIPETSDDTKTLYIDHIRITVDYTAAAGIVSRNLVARQAVKRASFY